MNLSAGVMAQVLVRGITEVNLSSCFPLLIKLHFRLFIPLIKAQQSGNH